MAHDIKRTGTGRTSDGPTAAANKRRSGGNPSYAGYEYQIDVTVWVGLDLMLAKELTEALIVEPKSHEDIEAAVRDPDDASLGVATGSGGGFNLSIQAKSRSTDPWTAKAFAEVLTGKSPDKVDPRTERRQRPLAMLAGDHDARYVFITNESLEKSLRPYAGEHLLDFPEEQALPPHTRAGFDNAAQAKIAPRLLLCPGVTVEVLQARIGSLLALYGHVPRANHPECVRDLRDEVRRRLTGHAGGYWTRDDLLAVLSGHGGSVLPTRVMQHYVRPRSYDAIRRSLDERHAVVIAGPSGTGKTLTADILEMELRRAEEPFAVLGGELGPGCLRSQLTRTGPVLFHLRDPWGSNRLTPGAEQWSDELPKLLMNAGPERKFLITSRSDILHSAGSGVTEQLARYLVRIEIEDYGDELLARIYDGISSDLSGHAGALAMHYRMRALQTLTRPYEIDRFLVTLSQEGPGKARKVDVLLAESQIDAISRVVADQITGWGSDGVAGAAILWAVLSARGAVATEVFPKLRRRVSTVDSTLRPDVEGLIDFLVVGRNLRRDGPVLSFYHPRVEAGLRMAMLHNKAQAEYVLSRLADALIALDSPGDDWGVETVLLIRRAVANLKNVEVDLSEETQSCLDAYLEAAVWRMQRPYEIDRAFSDLASYGSRHHMPSRLAFLLTRREPASGWDFSWWLPAIEAAEIATLRDDSRTQRFVELFIREILPFRRTRYNSEIVSLLDQLAAVPHGAYFTALETAISFNGTSQNIDAIVAGLLSGDAPDFEDAIDCIAKELAVVDEWFERETAVFRQAEEHEVDADYADHVLDEPSERYYAPQHAMEVVVRLRRERQGLDWVWSHPQQDLLVDALAANFERDGEPNPEELRLLLECAEGWTRGRAWSAVAKHWHASLNDLLETELARTDIANDYLRKTLVQIAALAAEGDPVGVLARIAPGASPERRLEMVSDFMAARIESDFGETRDNARRTRATRLADTFDRPEAELGRALAAVLDGGELYALADDLSVPARSLLSRLLDTAPESIAGPLVCLASAAGIESYATAERLLSSDEAEAGLAAVQAMTNDGRPPAVAVLWQAFRHDRYRVRRAALSILVERVEPANRLMLFSAAKDRSADVRLAWADLMGEKQWPDAVPALLMLLGDTRDFASHQGSHSQPSWSEYRVARAAARALGKFDSLPTDAVTALLTAVADGKNRDPFVGCTAVLALARKDDVRIVPALIVALAGPGLPGAQEYRPLAQAASWAVFDRAVDGKMVLEDEGLIRLATEGPSEIAGHLLMAFGIVGGPQRELLVSSLSARRLRARLELVWVTAAAAKQKLNGSIPHIYRNLAKLSDSVGQGELDPVERDELKSWSESLDIATDVQLYTAWLASVITQDDK